MSLFKNNQHDVTCGLSFIFMGSRHSLSTCFELSGSSKHVESEWRLPMKIKDSPQVTSCWLFLNNYNDARNNECKKSKCHVYCCQILVQRIITAIWEKSLTIIARHQFNLTDRGLVPGFNNN